MLSRFFKENQSLLKKQFMETLLINPVTSFSPEQLRQCLSLGLNPDLFYLIGIKCNTTNSMNILQNQEYYISYSLSKRLIKTMTVLHHAILETLYIFLCLLHLLTLLQKLKAWHIH